MGSFVRGRKSSFARFFSGWSHKFTITDQQKAAWFQSDICVSCVLYIATLGTINNGLFFSKISAK